MPMLAQQLAASPFDAVASSYDAVFSRSPVGRAQRSQVWRELEKAFHPGQQVLEIGCGTGVDACFLARRGVSVLASDSSREMVRIASDRVHDCSHNFRDASVQLRQWRAEDIGCIDPDRSFDGAFSNFGVMNCVPDLRDFSQQLATRLRPGAPVLLCVMGPCCLWELVWFALHGQPGRAIRRFWRAGVTARVADNGFVRVYYPGAGTIAREFAPHFRLRKIKGIGLAIPPSYGASWADRFPKLWKLAQSADRIVAELPGLRLLADHILLTFERVG